jgi:hypothetical protein
LGLVDEDGGRPERFSVGWQDVIRCCSPSPWLRGIMAAAMA